MNNEIKIGDKVIKSNGEEWFGNYEYLIVIGLSKNNTGKDIALLESDEGIYKFAFTLEALKVYKIPIKIGDKVVRNDNQRWNLYDEYMVVKGFSKCDGKPICFLEYPDGELFSFWQQDQLELYSEN